MLLQKTIKKVTTSGINEEFMRYTGDTRIMSNIDGLSKTKGK